MVDTHPGTAMPEPLLRYWLPGGVGGAKIMWGQSGDYDRCLVNVEAETAKHGHPLDSKQIHGLCATLHKLATGARPGHAASEQGGHH